MKLRMVKYQAGVDNHMGRSWLTFFFWPSILAGKDVHLISSFYWRSIQALLSAPNPDDPLSENIAKHWKTNEAEAVETGKRFNGLFTFFVSIRWSLSCNKGICYIFVNLSHAWCVKNGLCSKGMDQIVC